MLAAVGGVALGEQPDVWAGFLLSDDDRLTHHEREVFLVRAVGAGIGMAGGLLAAVARLADVPVSEAMRAFVDGLPELPAE